MYYTKSLTDLQRCIQLNNGLPLTCYRGDTNEIIIDYRQTGNYIITYRSNGKVKEHDTETILTSKVTKCIKNKKLATYSCTENGVLL